MKRVPRWIKDDDAEKQAIDEGSKRVKQLARDQKISIQLTGPQMEAILRQWGAVDNKRPAEITFTVEGQPAAQLRVAAYGYFSDTCCA